MFGGNATDAKVGTSMGSVLANFVPLAIGAIAPVMIALIVMLLGTPDGLRKASAFILGKMAAYGIIIILLMTFVHNIDDSDGGDTQSTAILMLKAVLGVLFLVMAAKTFFTDEDPDAPPSKLQVTLQTMGILPTFLIGFGLSFIQLRFVLLVMAGVGIIRDAEMGTSSEIFASLVLILAMTWPLLVPVGVYLGMGDRRDQVMDSMNSWLSAHSRIINMVVLTLFGIVMLRAGLSGLL